jgi:hypothetical protein
VDIKYYNLLGGKMLYNGNYIQLFDEQGMQILGSDGIAPYDARMGIFGINCKAKDIMKKLKKVKPHIHSYKIYRNGKEVKGN